MSKKTLQIEIYTNGKDDTETSVSWKQSKTRYDSSIDNSIAQLRNMNRDAFNFDKIPQNLDLIASGHEPMTSHSSDKHFSWLDAIKTTAETASDAGMIIENYNKIIPEEDKRYLGTTFEKFDKLGRKLSKHGGRVNLLITGYELANASTKKERGEIIGEYIGSELGEKAGFVLGGVGGTVAQPGGGSIIGALVLAKTLGYLGGKAGKFVGGLLATDSPYLKGDPFTVPAGYMDVRNGKIAPIKQPLTVQTLEKSIPVVRDVRNNKLIPDKYYPQYYPSKVEDWISRRMAAQRVDPHPITSIVGTMLDVRNGKILPREYSQDILNTVSQEKTEKKPYVTPFLQNAHSTADGMSNVKPVQINIQTSPQYTINTAATSADVLNIISQNQKTIGDMLADEIAAVLGKIYGNMPAKMNTRPVYGPAAP